MARFVIDDPVAIEFEEQDGRLCCLLTGRNGKEYVFPVDRTTVHAFATTLLRELDAGKDPSAWRPEFRDGFVVVWFGKYRDQTIDKLPDNYLEWALRSMEHNRAFAKMARRELRRRQDAAEMARQRQEGRGGPRLSRPRLAAVDPAAVPPWEALPAGSPAPAERRSGRHAGDRGQPVEGQDGQRGVDDDEHRLRRFELGQEPADDRERRDDDDESNQDANHRTSRT